MPIRRLATLALVLLPTLAGLVQADDPPVVSEKARKIHESGMLFDGHNDLPWRLRTENDMGLDKIDLSKRLSSGHTDIPRLREGGVKAQFWSVYIPSDHEFPAKTVVEQIDLVNRMVERYPDDFAMAYSADDVERIVKAGKIASLIGMEGGIAIEDDLAQLRAFAKLGARYMTLTHNKNLTWADAATDDPKHDGLTPFGERVVKEMNRLGMLVDISHIAPSTMADVLRVSQAPVIASHSSARTISDHPRNVPDQILKELPRNGGVIMVNFYPGFIVPEAGQQWQERRALRDKYPNKPEYDAALADYNAKHPKPRHGTIKDVADHIDQIVKVAGIDHVGIGSDFDGINTVPDGLEDVSTYPRLTQELVNRGYSETDIHKILGGNVLRAFRQVGEVAARLQKTTRPEIDTIKPEKN